MGIDPGSLIRAKAGVVYVLNQLTDDGHVYYPESDLIQEAREILKVDQEIIAKAIGELSRATLPSGRAASGLSSLLQLFLFYGV